MAKSKSVSTTNTVDSNLAQQSDAEGISLGRGVTTPKKQILSQLSRVPTTRNQDINISSRKVTALLNNDTISFVNKKIKKEVQELTINALLSPNDEIRKSGYNHLVDILDHHDIKLDALVSLNIELNKNRKGKNIAQNLADFDINIDDINNNLNKSITDNLTTKIIDLTTETDGFKESYKEIKTSLSTLKKNNISYDQKAICVAIIGFFDKTIVNNNIDSIKKLDDLHKNQILPLLNELTIESKKTIESAIEVRRDNIEENLGDTTSTKSQKSRFKLPFLTKDTTAIENEIANNNAKMEAILKKDIIDFSDDQKLKDELIALTTQILSNKNSPEIIENAHDNLTKILNMESLTLDAMLDLHSDFNKADTLQKRNANFKKSKLDIQKTVNLLNSKIELNFINMVAELNIKSDDIVEKLMQMKKYIGIMQASEIPLNEQVLINKIKDFFSNQVKTHYLDKADISETGINLAEKLKSFYQDNILPILTEFPESDCKNDTIVFLENNIDANYEGYKINSEYVNELQSINEGYQTAKVEINDIYTNIKDVFDDLNDVLVVNKELKQAKNKATIFNKFLNKIKDLYKIIFPIIVERNERLVREENIKNKLQDHYKSLDNLYASANDYHLRYPDLPYAQKLKKANALFDDYSNQELILSQDKLLNFTLRSNINLNKILSDYAPEVQKEILLGCNAIITGIDEYLKNLGDDQEKGTILFNYAFAKTIENIGKITKTDESNLSEEKIANKILYAYQQQINEVCNTLEESDFNFLELKFHNLAVKIMANSTRNKITFSQKQKPPKVSIMSRIKTSATEMKKHIKNLLKIKEDITKSGLNSQDKQQLMGPVVTMTDLLEKENAD